MRTNVIRTKSLHAKEVDESVLFDALDILPNISVANLIWDETEGDRETISFKSSEGERIENALKTSDLNLWVPVLAALLADELLSVGSVNCHPLRRGSTLVLVSSNLNLSWHFPDTLRDVVNGLHRVYICLIDGNSKVLRLSQVFRLAIAHVHLLTGIV